MKNLNSITLLIIAAGFLLLANVINDVFLKISFAIASIILGIVAAVRSFKEKNKNQL